MTSFELIIIIILGGSLKKYNSLNLKGVLIWICCPILAFLLAMGGVYAYFTATAQERQASMTTAIVRVGFSDDTNMSISTDSTSQVLNNILPGSTITIDGSVVNTGTISLYAILYLNVSVAGSSSALVEAYYTADGTTITENGNTYSNTATLIDVSGNSDFELSYSFDFSFGDDYQGRNVSVTVTAYAIQVQNIQDAQTATGLLMDLAQA